MTFRLRRGKRCGAGRMFFCWPMRLYLCLAPFSCDAKRGVTVMGSTQAEFEQRANIFLLAGRQGKGVGVLLPGPI